MSPPCFFFQSRKEMASLQSQWHLLTNTNYDGKQPQIKYHKEKITSWKIPPSHLLHQPLGKGLHDIIPTTMLATKIVKFYVVPLLNIARNFQIWKNILKKLIIWHYACKMCISQRFSIALNKLRSSSFSAPETCTHFAATSHCRNSHKVPLEEGRKGPQISQSRWQVR